MTISFSPSLPPSSSFPQNSKRIYFAGNLEEENDDLELSAEERAVDPIAGQNFKLLPWLSVARGIALFVGGVDIFWANEMRGVLSVLLSFMGANAIDDKFLIHDKAKIIAGFVEREGKAKRLGMKSINPEVLDHHLANPGDTDLTVLYLTKEKNNVADALMYDVKSTFEDSLGKSFKTPDDKKGEKRQIAFFHYDLNQASEPDLFKLPPNDLKADDYPCFAIIDSKGTILATATGFLKMEADDILEKLTVNLQTEILCKAIENKAKNGKF